MTVSQISLLRLDPKPCRITLPPQRGPGVRFPPSTRLLLFSCSLVVNLKFHFSSVCAHAHKGQEERCFPLPTRVGPDMALGAVQSHRKERLAMSQSWGDCGWVGRAESAQDLAGAAVAPRWVFNGVIFLKGHLLSES